MMDNHRFCQECNEQLLGRTDKKFCSDYCRNTYNNRQNRDIAKNIRQVNRILRSNRRILMDFKNIGMQRVSERKLLQQGFRINYTTGHKMKENGQVRLFVYDQAIERLKNNMYLINGIKDSEFDV